MMDHQDEDSFEISVSRKDFSPEEIQVMDLVDENQLRPLALLIGADKFDEIVNGFREEIEQRLKNIHNQKLGPSELARELHAIKSCTGNLGMPRISMLTRQLMKEIDAGEIDKVMAGLEELEPLYRDSMTLLAQKLGIRPK